MQPTANDNSWDALLKPGVAKSYFAADPRPPFDPESTGWSPANAWWLAEFSRLVYRGDARGEILGLVDLREACFLDCRGTQCAVVRVNVPGGSEFAAVVFRGTDELRNWLTNVKTVPAAWSRGGRVHRGFRDALAEVHEELDQVLAGLDVPVFHTGHSLGGALATLAASMWSPRAVYTFGAPRVGDAAFAATLAWVPHFRVVNGRDVVPTLPPPIDALGLKHAGELRHLMPDGSVETGGYRIDPRPVGEEFAHSRRWFDPPPFLADHAPVNYVARLQRLC